MHVFIHIVCRKYLYVYPEIMSISGSFYELNVLFLRGIFSLDDK